MPRLSIIIPIVGDLQQLDDTLVSVLENRPSRCEVIVALNQTYSDPYDLKDEVCFVTAPAGANVGQLLNAAIATARAPIVHLLAPGMEATPGWADAALASFCDRAVAAVAPLVTDKQRAGRVAAAGMRYTAGGRVIAQGRGKPLSRFDHGGAAAWPDLTAAFYRRDALQAVGGLHESLGATCCVDLGLRLMQAGYRGVLAPECLIRAAQPHRLASSFAYGRAAESLFWRWAPLDGWITALAAHAAVIAGEVLLVPVQPRRIARLAGRCLAALGAQRHRSHWRELAAAMQPLAADSARATANAHAENHAATSQRRSA